MVTSLTPRQQQFVVEYAIGGNAADAARRAGYSPKGANVTGAQLLANPNIRDALTVERQRNARNLDIRKEDVISGIVAAINMARAQANPGAMISGCVQLAKLCGFYEPELSQVNLSDDAGRLKAFSP
jgi:phage terminase small subunit